MSKRWPDEQRQDTHQQAETPPGSACSQADQAKHPDGGVRLACFSRAKEWLSWLNAACPSPGLRKAFLPWEQKGGDQTGNGISNLFPSPVSSQGQVSPGLSYWKASRPLPCLTHTAHCRATTQLGSSLSGTRGSPTCHTSLREIQFEHFLGVLLLENNFKKSYEH